MLRSVPSAIDDALDNFYEPNAVFSQFLGAASMTYFFSFFFPCFLFLSCLFLLFLPSSLFFLSSFEFSHSFLLFSLLYLTFIFLFICFLIDLLLSCVCVVVLRAKYTWKSFSGGKRYGRFFQSRVVRRMHQYGPGTS